MECFKCGILAEKAALSDVIVKEGVVKMCSNCISMEYIPVLRKPTEYDFKAAQTSTSVYDRLSRSAGLDPREHREKFSKSGQERHFAVKKQETTLRSIVDKNLKARIEQGKTLRGDLIDNFHWVILRARRLRKLTQEQVGQTIGESESAIKLAEKGVLPPGDMSLVAKLENFYKVNLRKEFENKNIPKNINFQARKFDGITIGDLNKANSGELEEGVLGEDLSAEVSEPPKKKWWKFGFG
ncbi:MAG: hypothetical protein AABW50_05310 [Nanoarchaeota archaeon]